MSARTWLVATGAACIALLPLVTAGCGDDPDSGVRGSGTVASEDREVAGFERIRLQGSGDLIVDVGDRESLQVAAEDNLLPLLTSEVRGSTLELGASESISPTRPITYTIGARSLSGVTISGSGDVVVPDLDCATFDVTVSGVADFDVGGSCDRLEVEISGTGEFDGIDLTVATAAIRISGAGDAIVHATDDLRVSLSGTGSIEYLGDPSTEIDISGTGSVTRRADQASS